MKSSAAPVREGAPPLSQNPSSEIRVVSVRESIDRRRGHRDAALVASAIVGVIAAIMSSTRFHPETVIFRDILIWASAAGVLALLGTALRDAYKIGSAKKLMRGFSSFALVRSSGRTIGYVLSRPGRTPLLVNGGRDVRIDVERAFEEHEAHSHFPRAMIPHLRGILAVIAKRWSGIPEFCFTVPSDVANELYNESEQKGQNPIASILGKGWSIRYEPPEKNAGRRRIVATRL